VAKPLILHEDRLFPAEPALRGLARELYAGVAHLPVIGSSRLARPEWFAADQPFANACDLILAHDPSLYRMLHSQGVDLKQLGVARPGEPSLAIPRKAWRLFARHIQLFRGQPQALWLDQVFSQVFGMDVRLDESTADDYYDAIGDALLTPAFRPRALFQRLNLERLTIPRAPTDPLTPFASIRDGWAERKVAPAYQPDLLIDPEDERFDSAMSEFADLTGEDVYTWRGYLRAHRKRRAEFIGLGATISVHGHPTAATADLAPSHSAHLFRTVVQGRATGQEPELFRAQMLTEMARMSLDDGLVMQVQAGAYRNHDRALFRDYGRDAGADLARQTDYVQALKPLLNLFGSDPRLTLIVQTPDEAALARELAPMAGHYPALKLGPGWGAQDGPEALRRFRALTTESAGFYNTTGFSDDASAFLSLAARNDAARRVDCGYLAGLVAEHRLPEDEAHTLAAELAYDLPRRSWRLDGPAPRREPQSA